MRYIIATAHPPSLRPAQSALWEKLLQALASLFLGHCQQEG